MRRGRPGFNLMSLVMVFVGILIILALVLPSGFWWFILGAGLIGLGFFWAGRC